MLVIYSSGLLDQAMSMLIFQVKQRKNDYTSRDIVGGGRWRNFINSWTSSKLTRTLVRVFLPSGLKPAPSQKAINLKKYGLEIEKMMKHREKQKIICYINRFFESVDFQHFLSPERGSPMTSWFFKWHQSRDANRLVNLDVGIYYLAHFPKVGRWGNFINPWTSSKLT